MIQANDSRLLLVYHEPMKRLLAYLFIFLGLGLVVNNFAFAISPHGCIKGNCHDGKGTYLFNNPNGAKYVGEWKYGKEHGQGTYTYPSGDKYVGEFKDGKHHGQGTLKWRDGSKYVGEFKDGFLHGQGTYRYINGDIYVGEFKYSERHGQGSITYLDGKIVKGIWKDDKLVERNTKQTQIAKVEPSQTQEVAKKIDKKTVGIIFCKYEYKNLYGSGYNKSIVSIRPSCKKKNRISYKDVMLNVDTQHKFVKICYNVDEKRIKFQRRKSKGYLSGINSISDNACDNLTYPWTDLKYVSYKDGVSKFTYDTTKTQIAKAEPTIKPKKKVKVAKTTQEEFKPEDKDIDNEAPVIEIAEAITVNDSNYEIEGKVSDKGSDKIYVKVDGRNVVVKKGKFKIKRYSPVDEQIEIVAIDQWGNKSKPKLVNIIIDIQETVVVKKLEPLNPSKIRSKSSNNKVALIIGIENYVESPKATYANLDAKYFFDYARKGFGVKKQNINLLIDDKATLGSINKVLFKWLVGKIKANQTDLIIFFAGHGLASNDGKELYFLPQDGDPDLLSIMALSRTKLFEQIIKLNPKSVTMFLDTCYSGISRDEQMLLASARPIRIVADEHEGIPDNFTIFSATELDQISSGLKEANHGIFSYYLMKGLEGNSDKNKDGKITNGELLAYMDENVSQKASELGRQQNPSFAGDPDQVLMSYR